MRTKKIFEGLIGGSLVSMDEISVPGKPSIPHDYGVSRTAWRCGMRMLDKAEVDDALFILDERAERCIARRDLASARRWRAVMAAIHAMADDETGGFRAN